MKNILLSLSAALVVAVLPACKPSQPANETPAKPEKATPPAKKAAVSATPASTQTSATPEEVETKTVTVELEDPVAVVNGEPIPAAKLREAFANAVKSSGVKVADLTKEQQLDGYRELLNDLIMDKLVTAAASKEEVSQKEIDAELKKIQSQFPSEEAFEKQIASAGQTKEKLVAMIGKMLKQQKWMNAQLGDETKVTEEEAKTFYEKNQKQFEQPETVKASHILILVDKDASKEEVQKKLEEAKKIEARAKSGEDFATLAKEVSEEPGAKKTGGDLGYFPKDRMVPEFAKVAFSEKVGQISDPVRTEYGWHIIKVTDKKKAGVLPFSKVKEQLISYLQTDKKRKAADKVLKSLKDSAKIKNTLPAPKASATPDASAPGAASSAPATPAPDASGQ